MEASSGDISVLFDNSETKGKKIRVEHEYGKPIDLYYRLYGEGEQKVVLIMGLSTSYKAWVNQIAFFTQPEHYSTFQLCLLDNRGVGRTDSPSGRYTTQMMAADIHTLLTQELRWNKVHIAGVSMGGMIAQELGFFLLEEDRLSSLSLIVTHAGGRYAIVPPLSGMGMIIKNVFRDEDARADTIVNSLHSKEWLNSTHESGETNFDRQKRMLLKRWSGDPSPPPAGLVGQLSAVSTHYVSADRLRKLGHSDTPITIITGSWDTLVRTQNSYQLARFLDPAEFVVIEGAGHGLIVEGKDQVNAALLRNFRRGMKGESMEEEEEKREEEIDDDVDIRIDVTVEEESDEGILITDLDEEVII